MNRGNEFVSEARNKPDILGVLKANRHHWRAAMEEASRLSGDQRWIGHLESMDLVCDALLGTGEGYNHAGSTFLVVQEGGTESERNVVHFDHATEADEFRSRCADASYRTSVVVEIPPTLSMFQDQVLIYSNALAVASGHMGYPEDSDERSCLNAGSMELTRLKAQETFAKVRAALLAAEISEDHLTLTGDIADIGVDFFLVGKERQLFSGSRDGNYLLPFDILDCCNCEEVLYASDDLAEISLVCGQLDIWLSTGSPEMADHIDLPVLVHLSKKWDELRGNQPFAARHPVCSSAEH